MKILCIELTPKLKMEDVEKLGYYDFMGYMEIPFFNIGGQVSIDILAELCKVNKNSKVLEVGCGTGANACYLAEKFGCTVVGVDISEYMVNYAIQRAINSGLEDIVSFKVGNAYNLDFSDNTFDVVLTIFVSQFLDPNKAFQEFFRVLRKGGILGVNEMYRAEKIPFNDLERVNYTEELFRELTELPFSLRSTEQWKLAFKDNGYEQTLFEEYPNINNPPYAINLVEEFGGLNKLINTLLQILIISIKSSKMRERFIKIGKVKKVLIQDKSTSKYFGYILGVGEKL